MADKENEEISYRLPSDAHKFGDELYTSAKQSVERKSLLPILKDELRLKIQTRRLSEGLDELKVDFKDCPSYPLTPEERTKIKIRKQSNRKSAKVCRLKKKAHLDTVEKELRDLMKKNERLLEKVNKLETEKEDYLSRIVKSPVIMDTLTELFRNYLEEITTNEGILKESVV